MTRYVIGSRRYSWNAASTISVADRARSCGRDTRLKSGRGGSKMATPENAPNRPSLPARQPSDHIGHLYMVWAGYSTGRSNSHRFDSLFLSPDCIVGSTDLASLRSGTEGFHGSCHQRVAV